MISHNYQHLLVNQISIIESGILSMIEFSIMMIGSGILSMIEFSIMMIGSGILSMIEFSIMMIGLETDFCRSWYSINTWTCALTCGSLIMTRR